MIQQTNSKHAILTNRTYKHISYFSSINLIYTLILRIPDTFSFFESTQEIWKQELHLQHVIYKEIVSIYKLP